MGLREAALDARHAPRAPQRRPRQCMAARAASGASNPPAWMRALARKLADSATARVASLPSPTRAWEVAAAAPRAAVVMAGEAAAAAAAAL